MTESGIAAFRRSTTSPGVITNKSRRIATLSGLGALILVGIVALLVVTSIKSLVNTRSMVDHTYAVIQTLDRLLIDIESGETRQRGYVITGDPSYLGDKNEAKSVVEDINAIAHLVADNPAQTATVKMLRRHALGKIAIIDTANAIRSARGYAAAAALVSSGRGKRLMDSLQTVVDTMKGRELRLLSDRRDRERSSLQRATLAGGLAVLAALILGIVAVVVMRRFVIALAEGRRSARYAETILNATTEGIYGLAADGTISFVNRAMATMLNYTPSEMVGKPAHDLLHHTCEDGSVYPAADCPMYKVLRTGGGGVFDNEIIWRKDGTSIPVEYSVSQMHESVRQGAVVTFRDITDRQMVDTTLRKEKETAESANQAKSDFLARMSHELRTPLNSVIGFSNVLLRNKAGNLREQDVGYLGRIQKNGLHLLALINDILDLSKIEAGRTELDLASVDVSFVVKEVASEFETQLQDRGLSLKLSLPKRVSAITTDSTKVRQILSNLVSNAIKFTREGAVEIRVVTDPLDDRPIAISVEDRGIGIPADRIDAIFDAFEQAEKSTTRNYGGTGLGLPICRSLCALLGFELHVESELGVGSTFTIDLRPTPKFSHGVYEMLPTPDAESAGDDAVLEGKLVLIIDDEADSRMLIAHQIASLGGRSAAAASGEDGLRIARDIKPDLITLDLLMPRMDGWDVMEALKADPVLRHIPVVVVSLVARERGKGLAAAMSVLSKPLDFGSLAHVLKRGVGVGRVLLVEDDVDSRHLLASYLYEEGAAEVRAVSGAADAIRELEHFSPDLVLLDLVIPQGGGEAFLDAVTRLSPAHPPQIIVVTGKELSSSETRNLQAVCLTIVLKGKDLEQNLKRSLREFSAKRNANRPQPETIDG